ncbi:hypothetical protein [Caballeronia grimmiae]|uniref:hypothetical protein n=1 Tax=Caballeronia grimmiae TaxID=1071679 RepID=UPI0038BB635A
MTIEDAINASFRPPDPMSEMRDALHREWNPYTPTVHARNMENLRAVYRHLKFVEANDGWTEGDTRLGDIFVWYGDVHPLADTPNLFLQLPDGYCSLIEGMRQKPVIGEDDGLRGTIIVPPWYVRGAVLGAHGLRQVIGHELFEALSDAVEHINKLRNWISERRDFTPETRPPRK